MLNACLKNKPLGFTLIEMLVGIAILAILVGVAVPNFQIWMLNTQTRTAAESIQDGIQRARAEAVARNTKISFTLTPPSSWSVDYVTAVSGVAPNLDSRSGNDGSANVTTNVFPPGATKLIFNNLGSIDTTAGGGSPITSISFSAPGGDKTLNVTLDAGGSVRMCDPHLSYPNPAAC